MNATTLQELLKAIEVHGLPEPPAGMRPGPDDMLTTTELAARLKQATRTVERWHRKGVVLGIKVDGVLMFYWPSVVARLVEKYQEKEKGEARNQKPDAERPSAQPPALPRPGGEGLRPNATPQGVPRPATAPVGMGMARVPMPAAKRQR
jgi:hypothetical protein